MRRNGLWQALGRLVFVLFAAGCGGGPTAPTAQPTPPPPTFPTMTGGWGGTWAAVWTTLLPEGPVPSSANCDMSWLITSQSGGFFSGTYERTGTQCADAGSMTGTVSPDGGVALKPKSTLPSALMCVLTSGDVVYNGAVSAAGALTAQVVEGLHCTFGGETFDRNVSATVSMNQR
jgi:hypothetical protein